MNFVLYWIIRAGASAIAGGLVLAVSIATIGDMARSFIPDGPLEGERLASALLGMASFGIVIGLVVALAALLGWRASRTKATIWTGGVQEGPSGDAEFHPAVFHLAAMSPEAREEWSTTHPSQMNYGLIVLLCLGVSGLIFTATFGSMGPQPGFAYLAIMGYLWGILSYAETAKLGGSLNRRIRRWTGMPAEVLAKQMFVKDAGIP